MNLFDDLPTPKAPKILQLLQDFSRDSRKNKIDLGIGVYKDETGITPVLKTVKKAETILLEEQKTKAYIGLAGDPIFCDLTSDLVGEFPELQGIMGGYFAEVQGFNKEIAIAVSEHYLPTGLDSKTPKKPFSIALALTDKIDTLVGFFGINQKPTSSRDPYALRRSAPVSYTHLTLPTILLV